MTEDGKVYRKMPPKGNVVNSVGAGDSMVAGFLTGYLNTNNYEKALQLELRREVQVHFYPGLREKTRL